MTTVGRNDDIDVGFLVAALTATARKGIKTATGGATDNLGVTV